MWGLMRIPTKEASRHIDVVIKAIDVLDCFEDAPSLSLKQIIEKTGLTRSRTMRLTGTLIARGYLIHDFESGSFTLGSRLMALGKAFERHNSLISLTRPILKYLVKETGESATLYVVEGHDRVALVREDGTHAIRFSVMEGQRTAIYAGAAGKLLLAFGPPKLRQEYLDSDKLIPLTPATITDAEVLRAELMKISQQGYATSKGERVRDSGTIAAPIFGHQGHFVGALGIAGPATRFKGGQFDTRLKLVLEASKTLSGRLGAPAGPSEKRMRL